MVESLTLDVPDLCILDNTPKVTDIILIFFI